MYTVCIFGSVRRTAPVLKRGIRATRRKIFLS
jgi:hypothetical protein